MRNFSVVLFIAAAVYVSSVPRLSARQRPATGPITGAYVGRIECQGDWDFMSAEFTQAPNGAISGTVRFRIVTKKPPELTGTFDSSANQGDWRTKDDVILYSRGPKRKVAFRGQRDANGYLTGQMDYPACNRFVLVPDTPTNNADYGATLYVQRVRNEAAREQRDADLVTARAARVRSGWVPPERRPGGGLVEFPQEWTDYTDATRGAAPDRFESIRPIDKLFQELRNSDYKCIGTTYLAWRGNRTILATPVLTRNRYVIECAGNCDGVSYRTKQGYHFGLSQPYPMLEVQNNIFAADKLNWEFARSSNAEARIRIHMWSNEWGSYGGKCDID